MKTVGVIPARWGSTRLPGKSLALLCGKPLVQWVLERARQARALDEVLVATDDARICQAAERAGAHAVMTRPDHPSGTDRVAEAVRGLGADVIVNIQGDEPLIDPGLIDRLARELQGGADWDMATAATPLGDPREAESRSVTKVVWDHAGRALYFSRAVIPFVRDAGKAPAGLVYYRHIGLYAHRQAFLRRLVETPPCAMELAEGLEQLRALHLGARIKVLETASGGVGVDVPEDIPRAEEALRRAGLVEYNDV